MCEICKKDPCDFRCPNFVPKSATHYCSICGDGIYSGEEYIRNDNDEYVHEDCIPGCRWLIGWLGYNIEIMDED